MTPERDLASSVLRGIYKRSPEWLLSHHNLVPAGTSPLLRSFDHVRCGIAHAVNTGFSWLAQPGAWVTGGACLGYSEGDATRLGLEVAADLVAPLAVAAFVGAPCVLYLSVVEEFRVTAQAVPLRHWQVLADAVEGFARLLASALRIQDLVVVRTDTPAVDQLLDELVAENQEFLTDPEINSLYALDSSGATVRRSAERLNQYRRNIIGYCPWALSAATGRNLWSLLVAENIHQVRAINKARELTKRRNQMSNDLFQIHHVSYLPPPSVTGSARMSRASERSSIFLSENVTSTQSKLSRMNEGPQRYWNSIWIDGLQEGADSASRGINDKIAWVQQLFAEASRLGSSNAAG